MYHSIMKAICFYLGGKDGFQASEKAAWHTRRESQAYIQMRLQKLP